MSMRYLAGFCLAFACWTSAWAQQYSISTFAGNGTSGFSGDSAAANAAQLSFPGGIALDSSGNLYIADSGNHRIRMVSNGNITTIAGTGTAGFAGDGKAATSAQLASPSGVAVDKSGNIFIADSRNNVVREISSGNISTVAGSNSAGAGYAGDTGAATSAQLNNPVAVAVDSSGNIYIADSNNNVIREVSGGNINTIVGGNATPYTQLFHPDGVAVDSAGNLYIADTGDRRILKFSGGAVTQIAGSGNLGFSGDNGQATNAALNDSTGVAIDPAGNIYIADTFNNRIRRVATSGIITTIAGSGLAAYYGDGGAAVSAGLNFPHHMLADSTGKIYIADTGNSTIRLLAPQAPAISNGGIVNAATFTPQVSAGALASVFGTFFAGGKGGPTIPLPTNFAGLTLTVNNVAAPILYVTPTQINFQVPWETQAGSAKVVINNGLTSNTATVQVLNAAPGLFVQSSGQGIVQNSDFTLNTPGNPAEEGLPIVAYLTGSGPVNPPVANGAAAPLSPLAQVTSSYSATIGGAPAKVVFAGLTPGFVGLLQMNIVVPTGLAKGDYPLAVTIAGEPSNSVTVSVTP